jgi:hypothetical protein
MLGLFEKLDILFAEKWGIASALLVECHHVM